MRGEIAWDDDPLVNDNVVICSFLPQPSQPFVLVQQDTAYIAATTFFNYITNIAEIHLCL